MTEAKPDTDFESWKKELASSKDAVAKWHARSADVLREYLDERRDGDTRKWNLFHSNIVTERAMLYGKPPSVSVDRRHADARDDAARVAGEMLERALNLDLDEDGDGLCSALGHALEDSLLVDFGQVRIRYEVETETVAAVAAMVGPDGVELAPAVDAHEATASEAVEVDYVHWRDFLWSAGARTWGEVRWVAFRVQLTRDDCVRMFGDKLGAVIPLDSAKGRAGDDTDGKTDDKRDRANIWEVWDKSGREVLWFSEGYPAVLKRQADALELDGFFPCPEPMVANTTTSRFMPLPGYYLAQDLYRSINDKTSRIHMLESALRATGVYDSGQPAIRRVLDNAADGNCLYPCDNWAMLAEKGGMRGVIDYFPLEQVVGAIAALREGRAEDKQALYEVTGWADIMRGQSNATETARAQGIKAQYGSVRIQARQDRFARFASDVAGLKAQVMRAKFEPQTWLGYSNAMQTEDAQVVPQALELLKSADLRLRVEIKPESVSLTDFAALRNEKTEALMALSQFLTSAGPLMAQSPAAAPYLLKMLQWSFAGLRGASTIEGVLDQAITQAQQAASQPQGQQAPDSKLLVQQLKGQQDQAKIQAELQADMARTQAEVQADEQRERQQAMWNTREAAAKAQVSAAARAQMPIRGTEGLP